MSLHRRGLLIGAGCVACMVPRAHAHPAHVSLAQVEHNPRTHALEVALKLIPEDLEVSLRRRTKKKIVLERSKGVDAAILAYLTEHFEVWDERGPCRIRWVGKEISTKEAWLYFEVPVSDDLRRVRLRDSLLFDLQSDQVNTVVLRAPGYKATLHFRPGDAARPLKAK